MEIDAGAVTHADFGDLLLLQSLSMEEAEETRVDLVRRRRYTRAFFDVTLVGAQPTPGSRQRRPVRSRVAMKQARFLPRGEEMS